MGHENLSPTSKKAEKPSQFLGKAKSNVDFRLAAISKTRRDKTKNTKIREMVGTTPILHHIQKQRIR